MNGGRGGPFFVDVHVSDAEAVMEDSDTQVDMPVDLLPTPRVDEEQVLAEKEESGGEDFFDKQLKMLNSKELEAKDFTIGTGKRKGARPISGGGGGSGMAMEGGATIRDLERKGEGRTKSFKFTVDLDFGAKTGSRSSSLKGKEAGSSIAKTAKNG